VRFKNGTVHIKGMCPTSKVFLKWLPQSAPGQPRTIYFGKYKTRTYDDIAHDDPEYLHWLIDSTQIDKIRTYAQEALDRAD
jgi:hypothetical protein